MTRIRYNKNESIDGYLLESKEKFIGLEGVYSVALDGLELQGHISKHTNDTQRTILSFRAKNLSELKKRAKEELKAFGVVFKDEVRPRLKDIYKNALKQVLEESKDAKRE